MRGILRIILAAVLTIGLVLNAVVSFAEEAETEPVRKHILVSTDQTLWKNPKNDAKAVIAWCGETGEVLYGENIDERRDPLSMTKVMTVYMVMKKIDAGELTLDTKLTASKEDVNVIESKIWLQKGEKMPVRDLIYGALLYSGNDAAAVLGSAVGGNREGFARLANEEAKALGCTNTHFANANGLLKKDHYTTCRDMCLIAQAAFSYDFVREVVHTAKIELDPTNKYEDKITVTTTNPFFYKHGKIKKPYEVYGVIGGKTGTWEVDNAALLEVAEYNGKTIYTVVMNDLLDSRYKDTVRLIEYAHAKLDYNAELEKKEAEMEQARSNAGEGEHPLVQKCIQWFNEKYDYSIAEVRGTTLKEDGSVDLEWKPVANADGYRILRSDDGKKYKLIGEVSGEDTVTYQDTTCEAKKFYYYYVRAYSDKYLKNFIALPEDLY